MTPRTNLPMVLLGLAVLSALSACGEVQEPTGPTYRIVAPPNVPPGPPGDAGKPAVIAFTTEAALVVPGGVADLVVQVTDRKGAPLAGRPVSWSSTGGGSFDPVEGVTDANGSAATRFTVSTTPGTAHTVTAASGTKSAGTTVTVIELSAVIGVSTVVVPRTDACGNSQGRQCESLTGNVLADAMRLAYGADFAITNAGLIRADLTCPESDLAGDDCPAYSPPPYLITLGQVLDMLPFGEHVVTLEVNGAELKAFLENGVSQMPSIDGRFLQVSGLCFTYDIAAAAGSRVIGAVRQADDGGCTGSAVDLTAASTYHLAENSFMVAGGDAYPDLRDRATTGQVMTQVLAAYVMANTPISPAIQGRIVCTTSGATACPTLQP